MVLVETRQHWKKRRNGENITDEHDVRIIHVWQSTVFSLCLLRGISEVFILLPAYSIVEMSFVGGGITDVNLFGKNW